MNIVELIAQTGGTLGLAIFSIWMLNRTWELRLEEAKRNAEAERIRGEQVLQALERNTAVMTQLVELVERLGDGTDRRSVERSGRRAAAA